ncbi:type I restriction enzyme S subunit [Bradyrhizobium yuanmingense]
MLPQGWQSVSVADVADAMFDGPFGSALKTADYTNHGVRVARLENIGHLRFRDELESYVSQAKADSLRRHLLARDDVLFSSFVDQETRVCLVPQALDGRMINKADCFCVRTDREICDARFLAYNLAAPSSYERFSGSVRGITRPRIGLRDLAAFKIDLPPLAEQRRIVAKLDALFARLARVRAELDRGVALYAQLRSQVFDSAISGQLVRTSAGLSWSEAEKRSIEERRLTYLAARRGSRLRLDLESTVGFMGGERAGWLSCRLADVISLRVGHAFKSSQFSSLGIRLLRGANVAPERVDWTDTVRLPSEDAEDYAEFVLAEGDIVIAMDRPVISSGLKIAQISAVDAGSLLVQRVANPRPSSFIENDYLALILKSCLFKDQIEDHATGSDLPHISGNDILTTPCPLPPLELQRKIVEAAKGALSHLDRLEAEAAPARALLDRLEAAILTKAFKGELVAQDPNDEPAGVLLERIKAARAQDLQLQPKRGRRATAPKIPREKTAMTKAEDDKLRARPSSR